MRNKATLALLIFCAVACGNGGGENGGVGTKAEFDRYERTISSLLAEEKLLKDEATNAYQEAVLLNRFAEFESQVRNVVVPAYENMGARVGRAKPGGPELAAIHAALTKYMSERAALYREEFLEFAARSAAPGAKLDAGLAKVVTAGDAVESAVRAISVIVNGKPELADHANALFKEDPVVSGGFLTTIEALRSGQVKPEPFLEFLRTKVDPWYVKLAEEVSGGTEARADLYKAARTYIAAARGLVREMKALSLLQIELNPYIEGEVKPRIERFSLGIARTNEDLKRYRERARAYRASLRK